MKKLRPFCDNIVTVDIPGIFSSYFVVINHFFIENFRAVGQFYKNFEQTEDNEVIELLKKNWNEFQAKPFI